VGQENFEWVVEAAANLAIERARAYQPGRDNLTWGTFVQQSARRDALSMPAVTKAAAKKPAASKAAAPKAPASKAVAPKKEAAPAKKESKAPAAPRVKKEQE
jgi:hypothetical protein